MHLCIGNEKKFTNEFIQFVFVLEIILCLRIFVWRWKELVLISHSCVTLSVKVTYVLLGAFDNGLIIYKNIFISAFFISCITMFAMVMDW